MSDREETKRKMKVMQAFVDGKQVGFIDQLGQKRIFHPTANPVWDWLHEEYLIKPEPLELWVNVPAVVDDAVYAGMPGSLTWFSTRQGAQNACGALSRPTLFRQVLDSDAE